MISGENLGIMGKLFTFKTKISLSNRLTLSGDALSSRKRLLYR